MKPKPIKAWAVVDQDQEPMLTGWTHPLLIFRHRAEAKEDIDIGCGGRLVRVTITIDEPKPKKRKGRK